MTGNDRDNPAALGRRTLFAAGTAGLALPAAAAPAEARSPPAIDTGLVRDGRVSFPNWRGEAEPPSALPPAPTPPMPPERRVGFALVGLGRLALEGLPRPDDPHRRSSGAPRRFRDLGAIRAHPRSVDPAVARSVTRALLLAGDSLELSPLRDRRGVAPGARELVAVRPYILVCRVAGARATVLAVWRGAQDR